MKVVEHFPLRDLPRNSEEDPGNIISSAFERLIEPAGRYASDSHEVKQCHLFRDVSLSMRYTQYLAIVNRGSCEKYLTRADRTYVPLCARASRSRNSH